MQKNPSKTISFINKRITEILIKYTKYECQLFSFNVTVDSSNTMHHIVCGYVFVKVQYIVRNK